MRKAMRFTLLLVLTLLACTGHHYPTQLVVADSLCAVNPDSALRILKLMEDTMSSAGKADRMYYELLTVKASDKADKLQPDAEHILSLVDYYEHNGDKALLPSAYYYAGRTYYELHDSPQALYWFQKAADKLIIYPDPSLESRVYSNIGFLFMYQGLYEEADSAFQKEYNIAKESSDSICMIFGLRDQSIALNAFAMHGEAMSCLKRALALAGRTGNQGLSNSIRLGLANLYKQMGIYDSAMVQMDKISSQILPHDSSAVYSTLASIFRKTHQEDSLLHYSKLMEKVGNVYAKDSACKFQTEIYLSRGEFQKAKSYFLRFLQYDDSVHRMTQTEAVAKAHSLYNYRTLEKEKLKLQHQNRMKRISVIFTVTISLLLLLSLSSFFLYYIRKSRNERMRQQRALLLKDEVLNISEQRIRENRATIASLEQRILVLSDQNERNTQELSSQKEITASLSKELEREKERLISSIAIAEIGLKEREKADEAIMSSPVYRLFYECGLSSSNQRVSQQDWKNLEKLINREFDKFTDKLYSIGHLSEPEYRMSLLIKIKMKPISISRILCTSKGNISMMRSRLYKRFFGNEGTTENWDEFIRNL